MKKNGKHTTTETQKKHEAQNGKFSDPENLSDSVVARIEELEAQVKRTLADYQNLEKRVQNERSEWIKSANRELLLRILPVLDTLRTASEHSQDENLRVSVKQFEDVLKSEGVEKIETQNKDFDPATMECVITEEVDPSAHSTGSGFTPSTHPEGQAGSGQGENKVLGEVRTGYMLGDKVLRPAQVKVGKTSN